jgi:hypothetical protein
MVPRRTSRPALSLAAFLFLLLWLLSSPAAAGPFLDIYLGQANISDDTVTATYQPFTFFGPGQSIEVSRQVSFDSSPAFGLRLGYWFEGHPRPAAALDLSHFRARGEGIEIDLIPISALFLLGFPMAASDQLPEGRLMPYLGLGLAIVVADFWFDLQTDPPREISARGRGVGPDFRAGLAVSLNKRTALFGELRYLAASLTMDDDYDSYDWLSDEVKAKVDIRSSQFLGGVSFRF